MTHSTYKKRMQKNREYNHTSYYSFGTAVIYIFLCTAGLEDFIKHKYFTLKLKKRGVVTCMHVHQYRITGYTFVGLRIHIYDLGTWVFLCR